MSGPVAAEGERFVPTAKNSVEKKGCRKTNETPQGTWLCVAMKVNSGSATHGFWLGNEKVVSQVIGEDQSRLPGRETVGEAKRGER